MQRALERLVGLEADDGLLVAMGVIDVASGVAHDTRDGLGVHIEDAALLALLEQQVENLAPQLLGTLGRAGEERLVALVGGVVLWMKSRTSTSPVQMPSLKPSHASCIV